MCLTYGEDDWHLFFNCEAVKEAWNVMGLSHIIQPRVLAFNNARDLIFDICRKEAEIDVSKAAVFLRARPAPSKQVCMQQLIGSNGQQ
jgi:hypothetical protein